MQTKYNFTEKIFFILFFFIVFFSCEKNDDEFTKSTPKSSSGEVLKSDIVGEIKIGPRWDIAKEEIWKGWSGTILGECAGSMIEGASMLCDKYNAYAPEIMNLLDTKFLDSIALKAVKDHPCDFLQRVHAVAEGIQVGLKDCWSYSFMFKYAFDKLQIPASSCTYDCWAMNFSKNTKTHIINIFYINYRGISFGYAIDAYNSPGTFYPYNQEAIAYHEKYGNKSPRMFNLISMCDCALEKATVQGTVTYGSLKAPAPSISVSARAVYPEGRWVSVTPCGISTGTDNMGKYKLTFLRDDWPPSTAPENSTFDIYSSFSVPSQRVVISKGNTEQTVDFNLPIPSYFPGPGGPGIPIYPQ